MFGIQLSTSFNRPFVLDFIFHTRNQAILTFIYKQVYLALNSKLHWNDNK